MVGVGGMDTGIDAGYCGEVIAGDGRMSLLRLLYSTSPPNLETGISEASKRVPIFSYADQGGKPASSFDRGTGSKPERLRSGSLQADLSLIV